MNKRGFSRYNMLLALKSFFETNQSVFNSHAQFVLIYSEFLSCFPLIKTALKKQTERTEGIRSTKQHIREHITESALLLCNNCQMYCTFTDDEDLKTATHYSKTKLKQMPEKAFAGLCFIIHDLCLERVAMLSAYGITEEILSQFLEDVNLFKNKIGKPLVARHRSMEGTQELKKHQDEALAILKNRMDRLMLNFHLTQPDLYNLYVRLRKPKKVSVEVPSLVGAVKNGEGIPQKGLIVKIATTSRKSTTTEKGQFKFIRLKEGSYTLMVFRHKEVLLRHAVVVGKEQMNVELQI